MPVVLVSGSQDCAAHPNQHHAFLEVCIRTENRLDKRVVLSVSMTKTGALWRCRLGTTGGSGKGSGRMITPDTFTTKPLRPQDQFEAWREWHQPVLDFLPQQSTRYGFPAEVHLWKLGSLAMSRTSVPPVNVARTKSNLRRDPIDHWVINYCIRGTHSTNTAGTAVEVPAKVPFL